MNNEYNNEYEEAVVLDDMYPAESTKPVNINMPNLPITPYDVAKTLAENPEAIRATGELVEKVGDAAPKIIDSTGGLVEKAGNAGTKIIDSVGGLVEKVGDAAPKIIDSTGGLVEKVGDAAPKIIDSAGKNFNAVKIASDTIIKGMELEKERQKTRQIEAMTNPEFVRAVGKYKNIDHALQKSYRERSESLDQLYEGLKSNDKDERMIAMNAISKIVSSSALSELDKIENKHHDPTQPLLDF